jgi:hypothetical protein
MQVVKFKCNPFGNNNISLVQDDRKGRQPILKYLLIIAMQCSSIGLSPSPRLKRRHLAYLPYGAINPEHFHLQSITGYRSVAFFCCFYLPLPVLHYIEKIQLKVNHTVWITCLYTNMLQMNTYKRRQLYTKACSSNISLTLASDKPTWSP